jgi:hypothetical protein
MRAESTWLISQSGNLIQHASNVAERQDAGLVSDHL